LVGAAVDPRTGGPESAAAGTQGIRIAMTPYIRFYTAQFGSCPVPVRGRAGHDRESVGGWRERDSPAVRYLLERSPTRWTITVRMEPVILRFFGVRSSPGPIVRTGKAAENPCPQLPRLRSTEP